MPIIRDIVYGAAANGASLHELCRKLGVAVADLDDSEKRADFETSCLAWEYALKMTRDPQLGLHIGRATNPSVMGLVGYLMQNSKTLLEAFRQVTVYGRVATNMFSYEIIEKKGEVILQYTPVAIWQQLYPRGARQAVEQSMAGTLNVFFLLSGERLQPLRTERSKHNRLIFSREQLMTPVLRADQSLFKVFEDLIRKKRHSQTFAGHVKDLIFKDFNGQVPPIEVVASRFNMTVRSLQRRLSAENTSFRRISLEITGELGASLLRSGRHRVADIARLLGYSSPRAFRRAFQGR